MIPRRRPAELGAWQAAIQSRRFRWWQPFLGDVPPVSPTQRAPPRGLNFCSLCLRPTFHDHRMRERSTTKGLISLKYRLRLMPLRTMKQ